MHPYVTEGLIRQRERELRRPAERYVLLSTRDQRGNHTSRHPPNVQIVRLSLTFRPVLPYPKANKLYGHPADQGQLAHTGKELS